MTELEENTGPVKNMKSVFHESMKNVFTKHSLDVCLYKHCNSSHTDFFKLNGEVNELKRLMFPTGVEIHE